jgi:hypothetical protein
LRFRPSPGEFFEENPFPQICDEVVGATAAYLSKTLDHVEDRGRERVVIYHAVFENDPDVTVSVSFGIDDPDHRITGLNLQDQ